MSPTPDRLADALRLVVRRYAGQVARRRGIAIPALLLPGIGNASLVAARTAHHAVTLRTRDRRFNRRCCSPRIVEPRPQSTSRCS